MVKLKLLNFFLVCFALTCLSFLLFLQIYSLRVLSTLSCNFPPLLSHKLVQVALLSWYAFHVLFFSLAFNNKHNNYVPVIVPLCNHFIL